MDFTKVKTEVLKNYAEKLAQHYKVVFKKTIHGKNKTELLKFIQDVESKYGKIEFVLESITEPKENLLEQARKLNGFKKSYEKKSREFLVDFIKKNVELEDENTISPVHFENFVNSPEMSLKQAVLQCFSEN